MKTVGNPCRFLFKMETVGNMSLSLLKIKLVENMCLFLFNFVCLLNVDISSCQSSNWKGFLVMQENLKIKKTFFTAQNPL